MTARILIVEDELAIREMLTFVMEQHGFTTSAAEDFDSAIALLKEPYPDLILLDWMFPGGSGIQLAKRLKQDEFTRQIPIIMLTARGEEEAKVSKSAPMITSLNLSPPKNWSHALKLYYVAVLQPA
jgi:two-component system phosphate regulon response regulator PhoB